MLKHVLRIQAGPCRRPHWHPSGRLLAVKTPTGGCVVDVDTSQAAHFPEPLVWAPDGNHVLHQSALNPSRVSAWPIEEPIHLLPAGRWTWLGNGELGRVGRTRLYMVSLPGLTEQELAKAPPGERWVWLKGLKGEGWAALRWDRESRQPGLSTSRGKGWPVEHLRLPNLSGLTPRLWSWAHTEQSWLLLDQHSRTLWGWTFPQGLEWLHRPSQANWACHVGTGVAWAERETLLYWDATAQELRVWEGGLPITGLAWNPHRQWVAATSSDGVDLVQLSA